MQRPGQHIRARRGFALVDALTALAILATVLGFALSAAETAKRVARAAGETRAAGEMLAWRLRAPQLRLGLERGTTPQLEWTSELRVHSSSDPLSLCNHQVTVRMRASGRQFSGETLQPCPAAQP